MTLVIGVPMAMLFRADDLLITDEWIRADTGTVAIGDVRQVWVARRQAGRGSRVMTAILGAGVLLVIIGGVGATGWLTRNWVWLLAAPLLFVVAAHIGLLDPIAVYLEKRHHELWIATDTMAMPIYKANAVEANKALRAIQRGSERHHDNH
jgi:Family of unknown function (DUF6232)